VANKPKGKELLYTILFLGVIFAGQQAYDYFFNNRSVDNSYKSVKNRNDPAAGNDFNARELNYRGKQIAITKHAKCRMGCRFIDAYEVNEVIQNGTINQRKSNPNDRPCPTYAIESRTRDGQRVRIVIAECDRNAKLVTVIDLENNYKCHCK